MSYQHDPQTLPAVDLELEVMIRDAIRSTDDEDVAAWLRAMLADDGN